MRLSAHWLEEYTAAESVDILRDLAWPHAERAGAYATLLKWCVKRAHGNFALKLLCTLNLDYSGNAGDMSAEEVYHARQVLAFFSKVDSLDIGEDKEANAIAKFEEAEDECRKTNRAFRSWARGEFQFLPGVERALSRAQRKIAQVLGPVPGFDKLGFRFGPGATTLTKKRDASIRRKLGAGFSCSEELYPGIRNLVGLFPHWLTAHGVLTAVDKADGSVWVGVDVLIEDGILEFAPKNAMTYRGIVKEPPLNTFVQLGYLPYLTRRLAAFGVDLRDQTRNQNLARIGSYDGSRATIDLTSASDMNAIELVFHLLPLDWARALSRCRTGHILVRGDRVTLEKFSSMGNGYTFPLESLIFWALAGSVAGFDETSVYGDDIIVPTDAYGDVVSVLRACGFQPNEKKSFSTGPFRESCGADWFRGFPVRPYYQKGLVSPRTLFVLHNWYVRAFRSDDAERVRKLIHPGLQLMGPDGYGDGHLIGDWIPKRTSKMRSHGYGGSFFSTYSTRQRKDIKPLAAGDVVLPHYVVYTRASAPVVPPLPSTTVDQTAFQAIWLRGKGSYHENLPIPDGDTEAGEADKVLTLPGTEERDYKKVRIYTLLAA